MSFVLFAAPPGAVRLDGHTMIKLDKESCV